MSPEELELLVIEGHPFDTFRKALSSLSDQDRKKLSKPAKALYKHISGTRFGRRITNPSENTARLSKLLQKAYTSTHRKTTNGIKAGEPQWVGSLQDRAALALFAVAPLSTVRASDVWYHSASEKLYCILDDRRPEWLSDWVEHQLSQDFIQTPFPLIYKLIKNGLIEKPKSDSYVTQYANWLMRPRERNDAEPVPPISKQLKACPLLMDDVYRVLHIESNAFNTNAWLKTGASENYESWTEALVKMTSEGTLDRNRVLSESLTALTADTKTNQLSGIAKFHKKLKSTPHELKKCEEHYLELLISPVAPVARLGLDQLANLYKAKKLNIVKFLEAIPTIFSLSVKSHPIAAIKLLSRIAQIEKKQREDVIGALIPALSHENADVQAAALHIIEKYKDSLSSGLQEAIYSQSQFAAAHLQQRLLNVSGDERSLIIAEDNQVGYALSLSNLPVQTRDAWGINKLREEPFEYHSITDDILQLRVLHTVAPIGEIKTQDELLSAIAAFIENSSDKAEGERIADAIARIPREENSDFIERVKPMRHRLKIGYKVQSKWELISAPLAGGALADLIKTYLIGRVLNTADTYDDLIGSYNPMKLELADEDASMCLHFRKLAKSISEGKTPGRLCTPTHENGWICPSIWISRLSKIQSVSSLDQIDLSYSMLRLAPDNRLDAASKLDSFKGTLKDLAAFVLGVKSHPDFKSALKTEVWMSAARACDPHKDWTELFSVLNIASLRSGAVAPQSLGWSIKDESRYHARMILNESSPLVSKKKLFKKNVLVDENLLPAVVLGRNKVDGRYRADYRSAEDREWFATLFPLYPAMAYRSALSGMVNRLDTNANSFEPVHGALQALFQKNRPWGEMGHLVLALGLFGRDADAQRLSIDALLEGVENGQLNCNILASIFTNLCEASLIKINRPCAALLEVAQISQLHAFTITDFISKWLPTIDRKRRSIGDVLDTLQQCLALARSGLSSDLRVYLNSFSGNSKAVKIARSLSKETEASTQALEQIRNLAISARLKYVQTSIIR